MTAILDWIATIRDYPQACDPYAASVLPLRKMIVGSGAKVGCRNSVCGLKDSLFPTLSKHMRTKMVVFSVAAATGDEFVSIERGNDNEEFMRIGDVSDSFGVTLRTLRFYEDKNLIQPKRQGVTRLYSRRDRARIKLILLGKKVGFSLREVKQLIDLYEPGGSNTVQMKAILEKSAKQLDKMKQQRIAVDEAISELVNGINMLADKLGVPHLAAA